MYILKCIQFQLQEILLMIFSSFGVFFHLFIFIFSLKQNMKISNFVYQNRNCKEMGTCSCTSVEKVKQHFRYLCVYISRTNAVEEVSFPIQNQYQKISLCRNFCGLFAIYLLYVLLYLYNRKRTICLFVYLFMLCKKVML